MLDFKKHPHRRLNPLTGEWILVSPHRMQRPWLGQVEAAAPKSLPEYDPSCYLCPGNSRAGGTRNPTYEHTFVFQNDFAALLPGTPLQQYHQGDGGLIVAEGEEGICRVVCFTPRHDLTLAMMAEQEIRCVVNVWADQYKDLSSRSEIAYVQIFENRGAMMGCSNPHPHCQIWASSSIPNEPGKELIAQEHYLRSRNSCLLCDYLALERESGERLICENSHFSALVPFWAIWPFEVLLVSRRHVTGMDELIDAESDALANILRRLTTRYDNLFRISFPYSMGFHQRPSKGESHQGCHFHAHFCPPLLRSASVRKFMVGYEMLATPQRDITAESAAERLREMAEVRFG